MPCSRPTDRFLWTAIAVVLFGGLFSNAIPLRAESPSGSAAEKRTKAYEWFNTLGYPDIKDLKFVRVTTGETIFVDNKPQPKIVYGFLISAIEDNFKVFLCDTEISAYGKVPANGSGEPGVDYQTADLVKYASATLKSLQSPAADKTQSHYITGRAIGAVSKPTETFVLSWACWRTGHDALAAELFDDAARMPAENDDAHPAGDIQSRLAADISGAEMQRAIGGFSDLDVPRDQLLARFERFVKTFPTSAEAAQARQIAAMLKRMVQEDKDHATRVAKEKPFDQIAKKDQIAELIFQLRDHVRYTSSAESAVSRLEKFGYDAVPQLIAALDDRRFSRTAESLNNWTHVLTVGDAAAEALAQIAGRDFGTDDHTISYAAHDDVRLAAIKKEAEAWYAQLNRKGEKQLLVEATQKGDATCLTDAHRLAEKYPDAAVAAIAAGIDNAAESSVRQNLFNCFSAIPGDGPVPYLLTALKKGKTLEDRLAAAAVLHARKHGEAVSAMIDEWKNTEGDEQPEGLVGFLATCGKVEAVKALADGLAARPLNFRYAVVSAFANGAMSAATDSGGGNPGDAPSAYPPSAKPSKAWNEAVVDLLFAALDDTEDQFMTFGYNGHNCDDPRICDIAAYALNQIDSQRFPFDIGATFDRREQSRILLKNVWRMQRGQPPLPVPELRKTVRVPPEQLKPLLDRLERAPAAEVASANAAIEKLGPGAVEGTLERMKSFSDADWPHRMALDRAARRLASTVVEIQFAEKSLKPEDALKSKLDQFKGKPLDAASLAQTLGSMATNLHKPVYGFKLIVSRGAGEAGTTLRVDLIDRSRAISLGKGTNSGPPQPGESPRFETTTYIDIPNSTNSSGVESGPLDVPALEKLLEQIPAAAATDKVEVGVRIIAD